ncbi:MAG: alpha/beta hydrolase [Bdellovibrionales bacterium]|nr:alpha/beta hydrolase [Bdellovibrionales bacterium]
MKSLSNCITFGHRSIFRPLVLMGMSLAASMLLGACSPRSTAPFETVVADQPVPERVVVFVPGFKGTVLQSAAEETTIWFTTPDALWGRQTLGMDNPALDVEGAIAVEPHGVLHSVPVLPPFFRYNAYGKCLDFLQRTYSADAVFAMPYDWRDSNLKAVAKLDRLVQSLRTRGAQRIDLVAHSMGALLTAYYLRYGTQDPRDAEETWEGAQYVDHVATIGAPFRGTMVIFRDMLRGTVQVLNPKILDREALSSFPSSYQLLPMPGSARLLDQSLNPLPDPLFDPRQWNRNAWGLLERADMTSDLRTRRYEYVAEQLALAASFLTRVNAPRRANPIFARRLLNIVGEGNDTQAAAIYFPEVPQQLLFTKADMSRTLPGVDPSLLFADGDGIVTIESALLPAAYREAYQVTEIRSHENHADLCAGGDIAGELATFLNESTIEPAQTRD